MTNEYFDKLQRIEGLTALPPAAATDRGTRLSQEVADRLAEEEVVDEANAFREAGWTFAPASDRRGYGVYKSPSGRLYMLGRALNIKFPTDASPEEIDHFLREHQLERKRTLGFADNLLTVIQMEDAGEDSLALSKRLASHPRVEFAEPVLVERVGHRGPSGG